MQENAGISERGRPSFRPQNATTGQSRLLQHGDQQFRHVFRAELMHDIGAMLFDGSMTDPEFRADVLVGVPRDDKPKDIAFPRRQRLSAGKSH